MPHFFVLAFLAIAASFLMFLSFFIVLFTGRYSEGMRRFVVSVVRWQIRVQAYAFLLTDAYPPFKLN